MDSTRRMVIAVFDGVQALDVTGPADVFHAATRLCPPSRQGYDVRLAATRRRPVVTSSGVRLVVDRRLDDVDDPIDTLLVAGGPDAMLRPPPDRALVPAIRRLAARAGRVASVCTGALLLGAAGLLDGRRATTHWAAARALREGFPRVRVEPDRTYVRDGPVWTSAGVTAGVDLALAMVEEDLGREVALAVARWLVLYVARPGGQSQLSVPLAAQAAQRRPLRELSFWIADNLAADLSVPALAARAAMSPRHFARAFRREAGVSPGAYVRRLRLEAARRALETSAAPVAEIAQACGFASAEVLHRLFRRTLDLTPFEYRRRGTAPAPAIERAP